MLHIRQPRTLATAARMVGTLLCLACLGTQAGPLADPTRPPSSFDAGMAPSGAVHRANPATARAIAAAARAAQVEAPPLPLPSVQSVQLPARGPAVALLDGRMVRVGDALAGRVVVSIDSQGVVLRATGSERSEKAPKAGQVAKAEAPLERIWLLGGAPKQPPGSVTAMQATYVPAVTASAVAPDAANRTAAGTPLPTVAPGQLSLAGGK